MLQDNYLTVNPGSNEKEEICTLKQKNSDPGNGK